MDLIWLKEFLMPHFEIEDSVTADCEISLCCDDMRFEELLKRPPESNKKINGFRLDERMTRLNLWRRLDDGILLFDEEFKVFYEVSSDRKATTIVARSEKSPGYRTALMRVVREYAMNYCRERVGVFMHSAALSFGGRGIAIAGEKNAGKTSLLMYLLRSLPCKYISNDRVLIHFQKRTPLVYGIPTVVTISGETISNLSDEQPRILDRPLPRSSHRLTIQEIFDRNPEPVRSETVSYTLSPSQFCRLLNVEPLRNAELGALIFPQILKNQAGCRLEAIRGDQVEQRLKITELSRKVSDMDSVFNANLRRGGPGPITENCQELIARLSSSLPCYVLQMGPDIYSDGNASNILSQLVSQIS
jgi:hypothetical protein